jgi:ribosomal subunit interface protein
VRFPLDIHFKDIEKSDFVYNNIWDHAEKLDRFFDRIVSCNVVVSAPHRSSRHGKIYHVQIRLYVPGEDIFISSEPELNAAHEDVYVAIRDAFDAARRKLEDHVRRLRGRRKKTTPTYQAETVREKRPR